MLVKIRRFWQLPQIGLALALLAALTFNNWLLGIYLNPLLFDYNGSVSEFSALTQPHFWVFRGLDITAGILLVLLAWFMTRQLTDSRVSKYLIYGAGVLGVANAVDALLPLRCSETLNPGCSIPVDLSLSHYQMPTHGYSSLIIAVCYLVLPVAGLIYGTTRRMTLLTVFSAIAGSVALEALLSAVLQYFSKDSISVRTSGAGQEIQMVVLGAWFVVWGWSVYRQPRPKTYKRNVDAASLN